MTNEIQPDQGQKCGECLRPVEQCTCFEPPKPNQPPLKQSGGGQKGADKPKQRCSICWQEVGPDNRCDCLK